MMLKIALMTTGVIGEEPDQKLVVHAITNVEFDQRKHPEQFGPFQDYFEAKEHMEKHFSDYDQATWEMPTYFWILMKNAGIVEKTPDEIKYPSNEFWGEEATDDGHE